MGHKKLEEKLKTISFEVNDKHYEQLINLISLNQEPSNQTQSKKRKVSVRINENDYDQLVGPQKKGSAAGRKKLPDAKIKTVAFKVSLQDYNKLVGLSKIYTKEGLGDFIRMVLFNYETLGKKNPQSRKTEDLT